MTSENPNASCPLFTDDDEPQQDVPDVCEGLDPATPEYFAAWRTHLHDKLKEAFPDITQFSALTEVLAEADSATEGWMKVQNPETEGALKAAVDKLQDDVAPEVLASPEIRALLTDDDFEHDADLITWKTLSSCTDNQWAVWCKAGEEQTALIMTLLRNVNFMKRILISTSCPYKPGASTGKYFNGLTKYKKLMEDHEDDIAQHEVLERMAFACAFRLCGTEVPNFDRPGLVDPIARYDNLKKAYLAGELDPIFPRFSDFELRLVVDTNATEEDIVYGREAIYNYRPELAVSPDPVWRYCHIVKTDIPHKVAEWFESPVTYYQILSESGPCGPTAWYGRFICKAFGMPTWGMRQRSHAAMSRWTVRGWEKALGGAWRQQYWDDMSGMDFLWSTRARAVAGSNHAYYAKVLRLDLIGDVYGESNKLRHQLGQGRGLDFIVPAGTSPWWALSMANKVILGRRGNPETWGTLFHPKPDNAPVTKIEKLLAQDQCPHEPITRDDADGTIIIPATCSAKMPGCDVHASFSLDGTRQIRFNANGSAEYVIPGNLMVADSPTSYQLSCLVSNVHYRDEGFEIAINGNPPVDLPVPYTKGKWEESSPIAVELGEPGQPTTIVVTRKTKFRGIALKRLKLMPVVS